MAKNLIYGVAAGIPVVCSHPAVPKSGDPVRFGEMTGIALIDELANGKTSVDFTSGNVYALSVKGADAAGDAEILAGDKLYYVDDDTPVLSKKNTGRFFGFAMEPVESGTTKKIQAIKALA